MCRYTVSSLCAGAVFANRPGMLYSCSEDILQVWQLSNSHYPSFKFLPQKRAMAGQAHHSRQVLSLITLFTPCRMFLPGERMSPTRKTTMKNRPSITKEEDHKTRKCRTFVSEKLPHTIMMNLSGASSRSAAHQFPMFMISPSFREGIRRLSAFFCSSS